MGPAARISSADSSHVSMVINDLATTNKFTEILTYYAERAEHFKSGRLCNTIESKGLNRPTPNAEGAEDDHHQGNEGRVVAVCVAN